MLMILERARVAYHRQSSIYKINHASGTSSTRHSPIDIAKVFLRVVAHPPVVYSVIGQSTMHASVLTYTNVANPDQRRIPDPRKVRERHLQRRGGAAAVDWTDASRTRVSVPCDEKRAFVYGWARMRS